jgi:hypothetical protein
VMITASSFFVLVPGPWDGPDTHLDEVLDTQRLTALIAGPDAESSDLDVALALMDLVRDDLQLSGTGGGAHLVDSEMRLAVRALERAAARAGFTFQLPFRDHATWRSYWIRSGAAGTGGWQARRDLLSDLFDESYAKLMAAQDHALESTLVEAVSPRERLGWPEVDTELGELRRHFRTATIPQDYRAVGNDCVHITEALSRKVYDHARHTPPGEAEPPVAKTKLRLDRYVESRLPGSANAGMRKFARATIELAQAVKHSATPTRTEAGILADAVILLANMLRRFDENRSAEARRAAQTTSEAPLCPLVTGSPQG